MATNALLREASLSFCSTTRESLRQHFPFHAINTKSWSLVESAGCETTESPILFGYTSERITQNAAIVSLRLLPVNLCRLAMGGRVVL